MWLLKKNSIDIFNIIKLLKFKFSKNVCMYKYMYKFRDKHDVGYKNKGNTKQKSARLPFKLLNDLPISDVTVDIWQPKHLIFFFSVP